MQPIEGAVIAAAGLGSRLGMGLPKCMLEIEGKTLLTRMIEAIRPITPCIHVVVGYREELVIEHCARHHRDVLIVRNPEFRETNTAASMALGSRGIKAKALFLDGDLLVSPTSLIRFAEAAGNVETLVGITQSKSEQAVFVGLEGSPVDGPCLLHRFSRVDRGPWEWANVVCTHPRFVDQAQGFVFQELEKRLPLPAMEISLAEVDTPNDLESAIAFCKGLQ